MSERYETARGKPTLDASFEPDAHSPNVWLLRDGYPLAQARLPGVWGLEELGEVCAALNALAVAVELVEALERRLSVCEVCHKRATVAHFDHDGTEDFGCEEHPVGHYSDAAFWASYFQPYHDDDDGWQALARWQEVNE